MMPDNRRIKSLMVLLLISPLNFFTPGPLTSAQQSGTNSIRPSKQATLSEFTVKPIESRFGKLVQDLMVTNISQSIKPATEIKDPIGFFQYNGLTITNIRIVSLDPFGTSVDKPEAEPDSKTANLLNRAHVETKERIIRKYLLFNEGDKISGFRLGETERILRQLSFIGDASISVNQVSEAEAEVVVVTQDVFSVGAGISLTNSDKGILSLFEKNISGFGHEFTINLPYDFRADNKIGFGIEYRVNNIEGSFADLRVFAITKNLFRSYGMTLGRSFISAETKYAGSLRLQETLLFDDLNVLEKPEPVEYTFQDYWIARSFMLNRTNLSRFILGLRYTNNNIYNRPEIQPDSFHALQQYKLYLASISFSRQKFVKTNLIYNFGRPEDIPYGMLAVLTAGREFNEFTQRSYIGTAISWGNAPTRFGYFNIAVSADAFINSQDQTERGILDISFDYFTGLISAGEWKFRGFVKSRYTKGFDRFSDEYLTLGRDELITGFRNDSIRGQRRIATSLEFDVFYPSDYYGFKLVFFTFADFAFLGSPAVTGIGSTPVTGIGGGIRIRNDNLIINTFQIRLGYYPNLPQYSNADYFDVSGVPLLNPRNFDAKPPSLIVYR